MVILDYALGLYRNRQHSVMTRHEVSRPLLRLLGRTWRSLTQEQRTCRVFDLLETPIIGLDGFTAQLPERYPDAGGLVDWDWTIQLPDRNEDSEARWQDCVNLLIRGLRAGGEARKRASVRIVPIAVRGVLKEDEITELADALWSSQSTPTDGLPSDTLLEDWEFLTLPEPSPGLAEQQFRVKWLLARGGASRLDLDDSDGSLTVELQGELNDPGQLEDTLWNVGRAIDGLGKHGYLLTLTDEDPKVSG